MFRAVAPSRHAQPPTLSQMLAGRPDPGVNQRVPNRFRSWIKAPLLGRFIRMIEIKLVDEFIQRHRKIGNIIPTDAGDLGKRLGT
jgi:hypothetical protein